MHVACVTIPQTHVCLTPRQPSSTRGAHAAERRGGGDAWSDVEEYPFNETKKTGEDDMLTRRAFTGVLSCAICAITSEFFATEAAAQAAPPAATGGVTRKILSQSEGPAPGYETLLVEATIESGVTVARHSIPESNPPMSWKAASCFP